MNTSLGVSRLQDMTRITPVLFTTILMTGGLSDGNGDNDHHIDVGDGVNTGGGVTEILTYYSDWPPAEANQYKPGSLLNGGGSWPGENKRSNALDWAAAADS